jgi:ABC-type branched-subunit amino acid transport system substrate-binding protein
MLIAAVAGAVAAQSRAAESQSAPGVSDTQIKIGQTIPYSGPASSFATIGRTQAAYYRMINDTGGVNHSVGVVTAEFLKEPGDIVWQDDPEVRAYLDFMKNYNSGVDANDWSNVIAYYMASAVVEALKSCGAELTRDRLLDRVSHMEEVAVPMLIPGITLNTTPTDYHAIKQMRLKRFDGARWVPLGGIISE